MRSPRNSAAIFFVALLTCAPASAQERKLDILAAAYPDFVASHDGDVLVLRNGSRLDAGRDDPATLFAMRISDASILDIFHQAYPAGAPLAPPASDFDPGRYRNKPFFDKLYGDCRKGEVEKNLVSVVWLPKSWGHTLKIAARAANALRAVSAEIDAMPAAIKRAAYPIAGTYACRGVADAGQPSMHAYGAAIDLNLAVSNYWLWDGGKAPPVWRNRMPREIVDAFERHGFIWGGRWYHYDTMHFEYRPELLVPRQN
jgi:D-alanyl-D-alanine carboxypeptidase-like protein